MLPRSILFSGAGSRPEAAPGSGNSPTVLSPPPTTTLAAKGGGHLHSGLTAHAGWGTPWGFGGAHLRAPPWNWKGWLWRRKEL